MNQSGVSVHEPITVGAVGVTLIEGAAKDLKDFTEEIPTAGHWPSWSSPELPDGLALCVVCWRVITAPPSPASRGRASSVRDVAPQIAHKIRV